MSRAITLPVAALVIAASLALDVGIGMVGYHTGYTAGRLDAYRETDAVLRDLEHALAPLVQQQAQAHEPQTREEMP